MQRRRRIAPPGRSALFSYFAAVWAGFAFAGAAGFLSKRQPLETIIAAIEMILNGGRVFPPSPGANAQVDQLRKKMDSLSGAQRRVLLALAGGDLNKQIAADLGVSEATVKAHLSAIFRKLGVTNRTQAILMMRPMLQPE